MEKYICIFGDSTAWGAWDTEKGGWVERLWLSVARGSVAEDYFEIYNLSVSGGTTETILERFENEARIRNANALIFQTGGNDASQNSKGEFRVSLEKFTANIEEIVSRAKKITNDILFIGFKNADEKHSLPVPWADVYYRNESIEKYDQVMKEICQKNGVLYLESPHLSETDFADGVHPNVSGHEKVFVTVRDFLKENNWIS